MMGTSELASKELEKNITLVEERASLIQNDIAKLMTLQAGVQQLVDSSMAERAKIFGETNVELTGKFEDGKSYANTCAENATKANDELLQDVNALKIHYKGVQKNTLKEIRTRVSEFESLAKSELAKDVPSGQTPQKSTFHYPTDLVQTSPHERILARYRMDPDSSMSAVDEQFEADESISSTTSSANSSSVASNTENQAPSKAGKINKTITRSKIARTDPSGKLCSNSSLSKIEPLHAKSSNY
jgi:hypothetical protein